MSDVIKSSRLASRAHFVLFGVAHALHVGRSDAGAGEGLSWVLPVAAQHLTLQVGAQRLNVVARKAFLRLLFALLEALGSHFVKLCTLGFELCNVLLVEGVSFL